MIVKTTETPSPRYSGIDLWPPCDVLDALIEGQPVQRIVLGAWYEQGSYLAYEKGRYELRSLPR